MMRNGTNKTKFWIYYVRLYCPGNRDWCWCGSYLRIEGGCHYPMGVVRKTGEENPISFLHSFGISIQKQLPWFTADRKNSCINDREGICRYKDEKCCYVEKFDCSFWAHPGRWCI